MKDLVSYCSKTRCYCSLGGYFEREADSPKLLKTLKTERIGWSVWSDGTRFKRGAFIHNLVGDQTVRLGAASVQFDMMIGPCVTA